MQEDEKNDKTEAPKAEPTPKVKPPRVGDIFKGRGVSKMKGGDRG